MEPSTGPIIINTVNSLLSTSMQNFCIQTSDDGTTVHLFFCVFGRGETLQLNDIDDDGDGRERLAMFWW